MKQLSADEILTEIKKCIKSFRYFLLKYCLTQDSKTNQIRSFNDWLYMTSLAEKLQHDKNHIIVNKCRQMAISWELAAYSLWRIFYFENWNIPMVSRVGEAASDGTPQSFGGKVQFIYDHLPYFLKQEDLKITQKPAKILNEKFGSGIHLYNSTDDSARGGSGTEAILDEFAFAEHADLLFNAISPSVNRLIINSTFNGDDDEQAYYSLWATKDPKWTHIEIDYFDNPEHNEETYQAECAKLGYDKRAIAMELDRNPSASIAGKIFSFDGTTNLLELNDAVISHDLGNNCIFSGHDIGFGDGHAYVMGYVRNLTAFPTFYIYKDFYETQKTPPEIALQFKKDLLIFPHRSEQHIADPSGDNKGQDGGESMFKKFARPPLSINFIPGKNDPRTGINTIETMLIEKTLMIHPRCKKLIDAICHAQYPTDHSGRVRDYNKFVHNKYSHILCALYYVLMTVAPRIGRVVPRVVNHKTEVNAYGEPVAV